MNTLYTYKVKYLKTGKICLTGGNDGLCLVDFVDHAKTKPGDVVDVWQFNIPGSCVAKAEIIGKRTIIWDMSKPIGQRKVSDIMEGSITLEDFK